MTKVTHVEVAHWSRELRETMQISRGGFRERHHIFVRCSSDSGYMGYGEAVGDWRRIHATLQAGMNIQRLLDRELQAPKDAWRILLGGDVYFESLGSTWAAVSAIEMALTDLMARENEAHATEILGAKRPITSLATYASNVYWDAPGLMADVARRITDRGVRSIKVHVGVEGPAEELPRLQAVRDAIGPEATLMVDLNCGYLPEQAIQAGRLWADLDIAWLEEPVAPSDWMGLSSVVSKTSIPVAIGENLGFLSDFRRAIDSGVRVLMPDAGRIGMHNCRSVDDLCSRHGVSFSPHNFSSGVLLGATIHLLSASSEPGPLEIDLSHNALYEELWGPIELDGAGRLLTRQGQGPGLVPPTAAREMDGLHWVPVE